MVNVSLLLPSKAEQTADKKYAELGHAQLRARTHNTRIAPSTDILTKSLINMEIFFIFNLFSEQSQPEAFLFSPENECLTISETLGNEHKMKMECQ